MKTAQGMVREFHQTMGAPTRETPSPLPEKEQRLRLRLIREETEELDEALQNGDVIKTADALADILYVTLGTAVVSGIDISPVFDEVHRSNMTKTGGGLRGDGKVVKGNSYEPPNIASVLEKQGYQPYQWMDDDFECDGVNCPPRVHDHKVLV
jgi:predicted HAD superfamily Cof-like phosphohydrolase